MFPKLLLALCLICALQITLHSAFTPAQYGKPCPAQCDLPRSDRECNQCLNIGLSHIVNGTGHYADRHLQGKIKPGGWRKWKDNRCAIYLNGVGSSDCKTVGTQIFGDKRCIGFEGTEWNTIIDRGCWVKFRKP